MTISIAWVRKIKGSEELILVSDSRLSGNATYWDQCSKVLTLPRSDSAIGFAGSTDFAYPLMQQLYLSISSYKRSRDRVIELLIYMILEVMFLRFLIHYKNLLIFKSK